MADALAAAVALVGFCGLTLANPSSTRRRIASERDAAPLRPAHLSIEVVSFGGRRMAATGSCPVAGRPRFLRAGDFGGFIIYLYYKKACRASGIVPRRLSLRKYTDFTGPCRSSRPGSGKGGLSSVISAKPPAFRPQLPRDEQYPA
jgi:hypothetical protein